MKRIVLAPISMLFSFNIIAAMHGPSVPVDEMGEGVPVSLEQESEALGISEQELLRLERETLNEEIVTKPDSSNVGRKPATTVQTVPSKVVLPPKIQATPYQVSAADAIGVILDNINTGVKFSQTVEDQNKLEKDVTMERKKLAIGAQRTFLIRFKNGRYYGLLPADETTLATATESPTIDDTIPATRVTIIRSQLSETIEKQNKEFTEDELRLLYENNLSIQKIHTFEEFIKQVKQHK